MPGGRVPPSKLTITQAGSVVTVTDGTRARQSHCVDSRHARGLATRFKNNPPMARKWFDTPEPTQLELPLPEPPPR